MGFGQGVELHRHRFGPRGLQDAGRLITIVGHLGVGRVVAHQQIVLLSEGDHLFKEFGGCHSRGGVVGIVQP